MTKVYVLLVWVNASLWNGPTMHFESKANCDAAGSFIVSEYNRVVEEGGYLGRRYLSHTCVPEVVIPRPY